MYWFSIAILTALKEQGYRQLVVETIHGNRSEPFITSYFIHAYKTDEAAFDFIERKAGECNVEVKKDFVIYDIDSEALTKMAGLDTEGLYFFEQKN